MRVSCSYSSSKWKRTLALRYSIVAAWHGIKTTAPADHLLPVRRWGVSMQRRKADVFSFATGPESKRPWVLEGCQPRLVLCRPDQVVCFQKGSRPPCQLNCDWMWALAADGWLYTWYITGECHSNVYAEFADRYETYLQLRNAERRPLRSTRRK